MITAERVYEVFGIDVEDMAKIVYWCSYNYSGEETDVVAASLEMLVAIINDAAGFSESLNDELILEDSKAYEVYLKRIKLIESVDSQGRKWAELLEELRS